VVTERLQFGGAYLTNGVTFVGFTVSNGYTRISGNSIYDLSGGGLLLDQGGIVSNCVIQGNSSYSEGGGAYCRSGGVINNSLLSGNSGDYGGGVYCFGGGAINNSLLNGNSASEGGGAYCDFGGTINNSTLSSNSADFVGGVYCVYGGNINNSILYFNTALRGANSSYNYYNYGSSISYNHCCAAPALSESLGLENITEDPLFVDQSAGDYRLQASSPCIDAGNNAYVVGAFDLAGKVRIIHNTVDIGAYEFRSDLLDPFWWLDFDVLDLIASQNDYAMANVGQLKHMASKAREAMDDLLPGGAGTNIHTLVDGFQSSNNYVVINLGQLKYVAQPFYDRLTPDHTNLWPVGMTVGPYPWSGSTNSPGNYAAGNIGQLKTIFSFKVE